MSSDRWVIPNLIACPYLNDEMENSQFPHNAASFLGPTNPKEADGVNLRVMQRKKGLQRKGQDGSSSLNIWYFILL